MFNVENFSIWFFAFTLPLLGNICNLKNTKLRQNTAAAGFGIQDAVKRVKQPSLSRIYKCSHNYSKSLIYNRLYYKSQTLHVNHKIHINLLFTKNYNIFSGKNTFDAGIRIKVGCILYRGVIFYGK